MGTDFYAHSHPSQPTPGERWQKLAPHLRAVAERAQTFAADAGAAVSTQFSETARVAGLLHDLGKYRDEFQQRIQGKLSKKVPHSIHGATIAAEGRALDAALAIAGHHGGIPSREALRGAVQNCDADAVWRVATDDMAELRNLVVPRVPDELARDGLRADVWIRLLFSCLVDADFLDTEQHFDPDKSAGRSPPRLNADDRLTRLVAAVDALASRPMPDRVRESRHYVFKRCLEAGNHPPGFFSLTVPTGGGKTLASMAFALRHCARHGLRRVIYVLPYLNIIEQNAEVLRAVFGEDFVLEHHSLADDAREEGNVREPPQGRVTEDPQTPPHRLAAENWDAPLIVTTNVQFFESLFANRPAKCRKLHRIPRSVVILDECQTLPPGLMAPILHMLGALVADYGTTVVFCTATQPAFRRRPGFEVGIPAEQLREIVADHPRLFDTLRRTHVQWPRGSGERTSPEEIAGRILARDQSLCVVNLRRHAAELYRLVSAHEPVGLFHLSTNLCPAHRLELLDKIRQRLRRGQRCRVIATQLVEAGVDLDFPYVMRAIGPLDSIAQAAGRCNREGNLKGEAGDDMLGHVEVFVPQFVNPFLAADTGFTYGDLKLFFEAIGGMFELDRSASRGLMATRGLYVFEHESALGNAPAHELFDRIVIQPRGAEIPARQFADYQDRIRVTKPLPAGVTLSELPGDMSALFGG